jgi:rod shape-determining protein MreC
MKKFVSESSKIKIINNLIVLGIAILGFSQKKFNMEDLSFFQKVLVEVIAPVQKTITSTQKSASNLVDNYVRIVNTSKENKYLVNRISQLENDLFTYEELRRENQRLKKLLSYGDEIAGNKIMARVIGWDSGNEFKVLRLNKGERDGLKVMAPVVTHQGLVGYIYRIGYNYADVLTILDPNNRVDVIVERTRTHGIVEGIYNFECILKYIMKNEPVRIGDKLVSAGVGGIYPKGIKIGIINAIDKSVTGMTQAINISPTVDFQNIEEVMVLIQNNSQELIESIKK